MAVVLFQLHFPQVMENFKADEAAASAAQKTRYAEFFAHLDTFDQRPGEAEVDMVKRLGDLAEAFCYGHKMVGDVDARCDGHQLGGVRLVPQLAYDIKQANGSSALSITAIEDILEELIEVEDDPAEQAKVMKSLDSLLIRKFQQWATFNEAEPARPFPAAVPDEELPCALGLGIPGDTVHPSGQYLKLTYSLDADPAKQARKTTAFDAATYEFWRAGGATFPLTACRGAYVGLLEVTHPPILIGQLHHPITSFDA